MGIGCVSDLSHLFVLWELISILDLPINHLFQEGLRTRSLPCNDFFCSMNRCGPFFPPLKTGLLGPKPDLFAQLGKGEEWTPEDASRGFCLGKTLRVGGMERNAANATGLWT